MNDNQIRRYLKTEELYQQILSFTADNPWTTEGQVRGLLDGILSQGKIEGRLSAMSDPVEPQAGHLWRRRDEPEDIVEIESVGRDVRNTVHVSYWHTSPAACPCGQPESGVHARRGHWSRNTLGGFAQLYTLAQVPPDRLIEQWQCIVGSVSSQPTPERPDRAS